MGFKKVYKSRFGYVLRWVIALSLLPVLFFGLFLLLLIPFEYLISFTTQFNILFHLLLWGVFGTFVMGIFLMIGNLASVLLSTLVDHSMIFISLFFWLSLFLWLAINFITWSSYTEFSWQMYRYSVLNNVLFSFFSLNIFSPAFYMYTAKQETSGI